MIILESSEDVVLDPLTAVTPYDVMGDHKLEQKHNSEKLLLFIKNFEHKSCHCI